MEPELLVADHLHDRPARPRSGGTRSVRGRRCARRDTTARRRVLAVAVAMATAWVAVPVTAAREQPAPPELELDGDSRAGHVTASWKQPEKLEESQVAAYELQEARDPSFTDARVQYRGLHTSSVISGLPDGDFHYRLRYRLKGSKRYSEWSETQTIEIEHYSLQMAGALFGLGALVFLLTAGFIIVAKNEV